jgi:hypothetical protein
MQNTRHLKVFEFAKLVSAAASVFGLICGIVYSFGGLIIDLTTIGFNLGTSMAFGALIGMPILFAIFGFIDGVILAVLYNLIGYRLWPVSTDLFSTD